MQFSKKEIIFFQLEELKEHSLPETSPSAQREETPQNVVTKKQAGGHYIFWVETQFYV